jgi:cell division protein FtsN
MGRLIRISIYALVIFILYFWVTVIVKSYNKSRTGTRTDVSGIDTTLRDSIYQDSILNDTSEMNITDDGKTISNEEIVDGAVDYHDLDAKVEILEEKKKNKPVASPPAKSKETTAAKSEDATVKQTTKPATKPKEKISEPVRDLSPSKIMAGDGGPYMVMAGSYLLKENAEKMRSKLKNMGFSQAEIVVFPASEYHSVVAVRYSSESKAQAAASELKRKGIDSFVKGR